MNGQMQAMLSHHNKVIVVRFDLHCEKYTSGNTELSRFTCKVRKRLYSHYKCTRFGYLWVREQERSKSQHYHVMLIIDANKIQHPSVLLGWLQERCSVRGHPRPFVPKHCFYKLHRGDEKTFGEAFYRCSYLAKAQGDVILSDVFLLACHTYVKNRSSGNPSWITGWNYSAT